MPCYSPLRGFRAKSVNSSGKRGIVFNPGQGFPDLPVDLPCGQCIGCRIARSREWALRCVHEASLHTENSFITLTYNDSNLPSDGGLRIKHFQDFMKRFRKDIEPAKIRFFHCGEYGSKNKRPHYHAIVFGYSFPDRSLYKNARGNNLYISEQLSRLWPFGFSIIGEVSIQSANYVARYCMKKVTGDKAIEHYQTVNTETGELHQVSPEYVTMSRRPGIAADWYKQYQSDCFPKDFITHEGAKFKVPKFYGRLLEESHEEYYRSIKDKRVKEAKKRHKDNTPERLEVRKKCKELQLRKLEREI